VSRYGTTSTVQITEVTCLWYGTWRTDTVRVILVRETSKKTTPAKDYGIALVTTDLSATPEQIITRYAARWSIEVTFFDVKHILGVGQARNRTTTAVERTVPFGLFCHSILTIWYALHGHDHTDTTQRRTQAPWYKSKTKPSTWEHAHQTPPPHHHHPISPHLPPTSHNPRNPERPDGLSRNRRISAKVESVELRSSRSE
jgi:hypothetical protein